MATDIHLDRIAINDGEARTRVGSRQRAIPPRPKGRGISRNILMTKKRIAPPIHVENAERLDIDRVAKRIEEVVGEPVSGVMTSHGVTLLELWHELWEGLNKPLVDTLEAIQLNAELLQVGRIMQACAILGSNAVKRLNYAIYSLTRHHLEKQKRNKQGDYIIEMHLYQDDASYPCSNDLFFTTN